MRASATPSIRARLIRAALAYTLLGAAVSGAAAAFAVSVVVRALMDSALEETAQALVVLAEHEKDVASLARGAALPATPHRETLIWQLRDADGALLARSHDAPPEPWPVPLFEGHQQSLGLAVYTLAGRNVWLQVAQPLAELRRAQRAATLQAGSAVILLGLLAAGAVAWRIRVELRPLARIARDVEAINPGPVAAALPRSPRRELEPVYAALERLLQRLARKLRSEQAFAAHAAHSLRTPLAGLAAQLEVACAQAPGEAQPRLKLALESARRLTGVLEALLAMARATDSLQWRRFDASVLGAVALGRQIDVDVAALATAPALHGDPDLLAVAVTNLVDNAARHGAAHARILAALEDGMQRIEVIDDGPGTAPERLTALRAALARFDRSGAIDPALGLGLTLVAAVARAHGGRLDLDCEPPPKRRFCVRLTWPLAPAD